MSSVPSKDTHSDSEITAEAKEAIKETLVGGLMSQLKVLNQFSTDGPVTDVEKISQEISENPILNTVVELVSGLAALTGNVEKLNEYPAKARKESAEREETCEQACALLKGMSTPMDEFQKGEKSFGEVAQHMFDHVTATLKETKEKCESEEESKE